MPWNPPHRWVQTGLRQSPDPPNSLSQPLLHLLSHTIRGDMHMALKSRGMHKNGKHIGVRATEASFLLGIQEARVYDRGSWLRRSREEKLGLGS